MVKLRLSILKRNDCKDQGQGQSQGQGQGQGISHCHELYHNAGMGYDISIGMSYGISIGMSYNI